MTTLATRVPQIVAGYRYDATIIQREMVATLATLEGLTKPPRVLDVDDAVWLRRRGRFIRPLVSGCVGVMCGNAFIADYFSRYSKKVWIVPTGVDTERYVPVPFRPGSEGLTVGWCGTSSGFEHLCSIGDALAEVMRHNRTCKLAVMADAPPPLPGIPNDRFRFYPWSPSAEVSFVQDIDVGIMPLVDTDEARGKCSYKMLTYMACGVPVVVSPVGMNAEVLGLGESGFGARTSAEWVESLLCLLREEDLRRQMGAAGRTIVTTHLSMKCSAKAIAQVLAGL